MTRRRIQAVGFVLGLAGLVVVVVTSAGDIEGAARPSALAFAAASGAAGVSLLAAGQSWATLLKPGPERRDVLGALYLSQLSKYLPAGGLVQAAGQVSMSSTTSIPVRRAAVAYPVAVLEIVVAGSVLSSALALQATVPGWARVAAAAAPLTIVTLHPRLLRGVLAVGRRISHRVPDGDHLPDTPTIARSWAWAAVNMTATSLSFVLIVRSLAPDVALAPTFAGFAAAWVIGFLVIPVPSGLGVREAVLLVSVPGLDPAVIVAASLAHRIATVIAEVLVTAGNRGLRRLEGSRRISEETAP